MTMTDKPAPPSTAGQAALGRRGPSHSLIAAALLGLVLLGANYKLTLGLAAPKWDADMFFAPFQMLV